MTFSTLTREQQCLLALSRSAWNRRGAAKRFRLPCNEETLTENMLLDLALTYPGRVAIVPFNKDQEAKNGADWAWAFASEDGARSLPMLVQAKKLDNRERRYSGIKRGIGKKKPKVRQIDQLLQNANRLGFSALYAFYNHLDKDLRVPPNCPSLRDLGIPKMVSSWGISFAAAENVFAALDDETFTTHSRHSLPFHCLLCTLGDGERAAGGSPEWVSRSIDRLRRQRLGIDPEDGHLPGIDLVKSPGPRIWEGLPPLFEIANAITDGGFVEATPQQRAKLRDQFPGIAGMAIFWDRSKAD